MNSSTLSLRDAIIRVLSEQWPLTVRGIYSLVVKETQKAVSYQAVYKLVKQFEAEGVLEVKDKKYALSLGWIEKVKGFSKGLEESYLSQGKNNYLGIDSKDYTTLNFTNAMDLARFLVHYFFSLPNPTKKKNVFRWNRMYPLVGFSKEEYAALKKFYGANPTYIICCGNGFMDKMFKFMHERIDVNVKLGINCASEADVWVVGDYIGRIYWPSAVRKEWQDLHTSTNSVASLDLTWLIRTMHERNMAVSMTIEKNASLADSFRAETLPYFKGAAQ